MSKSLEGFQDSMALEGTTAAVAFIGGGILVTHIDQGVIGHDYNSLTEKINPVQNQVDSLEEADRILTSERVNSNIAGVMAEKKAEVQVLTEKRSHHHAPIGTGAEMITDGGFTLLAILAVGSIHRAIYKRRHTKNSGPSPVRTLVS